MDACGLCGVLYQGEMFVGKQRIYICPNCKEKAQYNFLIVCPDCGHTSWFATDKTLNMLTFFNGKCPDCLNEFHSVDGFKRRE